MLLLAHYTATLLPLAIAGMSFSKRDLLHARLHGNMVESTAAVTHGIVQLRLAEIGLEHGATLHPCSAGSNAARTCSGGCRLLCWAACSIQQIHFRLLALRHLMLHYKLSGR